MYRVARKEEKFGETFRGRASTRHRSKFPNPFLSPFSNRANCTRRDLKPVSRYPCQFSIVARRCTFSYLSVFRLSLSLSLSIFDFPLSVHSFAVFILPSKMRIEWRRGGRGSIDNRGEDRKLREQSGDKVRDRDGRERVGRKGGCTNRIAFTALEPSRIPPRRRSKDQVLSLSLSAFRFPSRVVCRRNYDGCEKKRMVWRKKRDLKFSVTPFTWIPCLRNL